MAINYDEDRTESTQDSLIVIAQLSSMLVSDVRQENIQALAALQQLGKSCVGLSVIFTSF